MIETDNTNELRGQTTLDDLLPRSGDYQSPQPPEGYDAEGNLLNVDYPPLQSPHTSAPANAAEVSVGTVLSDTPPTATAGDSTAAATPTGAGVSGEPSPSDTVAGITDPTDAAPRRHIMAEVIVAKQARLTILATEINTITEQTKATVISAALAVGKRLIEAKSICPAGRFGEWLATAVNYSERKAQDMMRLYLEYGRDGSIPDSIAALDYSKAVALLAAPADAREALAEQAADEDLSVRQLQQEIRRLKDEAAQAQRTIFDQDYKLKRAEREMEDLNDAHADTVANLNAARDALNRKEEDYIAELDRKDAELKGTRRIIADNAEAVKVAQAKAAAADAAAEQLKKLRAEAEERADQQAQRAGDAIKRANDTAKQLAEAKAKIQALSEAAAASATPPEVQTVEVVPEEVQRELDQLRRDLAEARATRSGGNLPPSSPAPAATATEKFKWFYQNQMKPTFTTALNLLREVAQEDGHAADAFATAMTNACKVLMNQLGTSGN